MEGNEIKVVCINYKKSHGGNKVKQKLQKKLGKALDNKQISGVKNVHGIKTESVLQVAFNVNYLVLLLKDGRVCRIQCSGNNDVTDNASGYEPGRESFQVVSDLEYARVLQRQYDTERPSWSYPAMDRAHDCMVRLHDPLSSSLYDVHVEHHGVINTPTFDPTPFEEEMAIIDTPPFRERRKFTSPNRDYGRVKSFDKFRMKNFDKLSRSSYYPKFGTLEWLTVEQSTSGGFVAMAVMHSEILLVDGLTRQLFSWSCQPGITTVTPQCLTRELGLHGERIVQLASSEIRATVVTESGKITTFYDRLLQSTNGNGSMPSLIELLTHSCQQMLGPGEVVKNMAVADFYTAMVTEWDKVYWWGLSPQDGSTSKGVVQSPVSLAKEKQKKLTVGCRVSLKNGPNYGLNMPVFHSSTTLGPRLGYTVDPDDHSVLDPKVSVLVKVDANSYLNSETERPCNASSSILHSGKKVLEVWSRSQVTFLDNPTPLYGEVIAIDQQQAVVKLENGGSDKPAVKILKLSELEVSPLAGNKNPPDNSFSAINDNFPTSSTQPIPPVKSLSFTKHIAGIIQHKPLCILDGSCQWKPAESFGVLDVQLGTMVTGFRPITIHATKDGIMLLVERKSDFKTFLLFPAALTTGLVRGSSYVATGNGTNYHNKCTIEEDAVISTEGGFVCNDKLFIQELKTQDSNDTSVNRVIVGGKRSHSDDSDDYSNDKYVSTECVPQLVTCMDSNLLLVKNAHGIVSLLSEGSQIIRSINGIHSDNVISQPVSDVVISHRAVTKETNSIVVAIVPRKQQLLPAVQQGDVTAVMQVVDQLSVVRAGSKGKDLAGKPPGVGKKIRLETSSMAASHDPTQTCDDHMPSSHGVLLECAAENNNVVHICCSMTTGKPDVVVNDQSDFSSVEMHGDNYQCITMKEELKTYSLEELRYRDIQGTPTLVSSSNKESMKKNLSVYERQLEILDILLKSSCVRSTVNYLLCCRNQYGCTPFLHAILQRNYTAALKVMEHVTSSLMNSSDDPMGEALVERASQPSDFFARAILAPNSKGMTPLHAFFASISGVYDSLQMCLHVTGLPSGFTAQQLLKYCQLQFPSAYRAEVFQDSPAEKASDSEEEEEDEEDKDSNQDNDVEHELPSAFCGLRPRHMSSPPLRGPGDTILFPEGVPLLTAAEMRRYRDRNSRRRRPPHYTSSGIFARVGGTGYVFFSDIHQLRAALLELDNTSVNVASHTPGGGPFFGASTTQVTGRITVRLAGTHGFNPVESDSEEEEGDERDKECNDGHKAKASIGGALNDLKKLHDIIMASKRTCSPTFSQVSSISTTTTPEQQSALKLFAKLMEHPQIVTAKDSGGETALTSLVHNPACLRALKTFFCKPVRSTSKKLPRSNPYRMTSSAKNSRGRHSMRHYNPHNIDSLLSSNTTTHDTPTSKVTTPTSNGVVNQTPSEVAIPSLPEDATSIANMVDQLVRKHVNEELSKDNAEKQPVTEAATVAKLESNTTPITTQAVEDDVSKVKTDDGVATTSGRLSPLFPNITGEDDSKPQDKAHGASGTATNYGSVLLSLTGNWSMIVTTILGICLPSCGEEPKGIPGDSDHNNKVDYSSQACDYFIQDLLYNCDPTVAESIADTIITKLNDGFAADRWSLDEVLKLEDDSVEITEANVALIVGKKMLHSLVRLLAIELSDPIIGGEEANERASKNKSVIVLIQKLLSKFSWLAVKCIADATAATSSPVCLGVCKPMIAASVSSDHSFMRSAAMRHAAAMGFPTLERNQQSSGHKRRVHVKQCFPSKSTNPKATLPQDGIRMVSSCGQEEMEELNSFETDPMSMEGDEQMTQSVNSEDVQQYNETVVLSPLPRPRAPSPDGPGSFVIDMSNDSLRESFIVGSPAMDEDDSSLDDEEEYTMLINQGVLRPTLTHPSEDYIRMVPPSVSRVNGGGRGDGAGEGREDHEDVYPFAWALDGRNMNENTTTHSHPRPSTPLFGLPSEPINHMLNTVPSLRYGAGFLARTFCRLTKEMVDIAVNITSTQYVSPQHHKANMEAEVVSLKLPKEIKEGLITSCTTLMQPTWQWLVRVLDVAQGQLEQGELFDTTSYVMSLKARNHQHTMGMARPFFSGSSGGLGHSGSSPADYLTYLLRSHTAEQNNCLPILDLTGYEHVVYMLDALMYSLSKWPKEVTAQSYSAVAEDCSKNNPTAAVTASSDEQPPPQSSMATPNSTISRFFQRTQSITLNYADDVDEHSEVVTANSSFNRSIMEEIPLAQQPHLLEPFLKKEEQAATFASRRRQSSCYKLPLSYSRSSITGSGEDQQGCIVTSWSMEDALQRWQTVIKVFAHIFLAEGPGNERDNFLNPHAGFASRMARFRHKVAHYLETNAMHRDRSWGGLSVGDPHVLSIRVRRSHLLQDSLQLLANLGRMQYSQVRVKFEGEDGSGPGVNRGFFASFAAALKNPAKECLKVGVLLYEPGKKPEQSGLYSPSPIDSCSVTPSRINHFKAIGRFLGLALLFRYNIPLMLCRHVAKYLIGRELSWHDVAFYNADLYEGLRRMIRDVESDKNSAEDFHATYCCFFEVTHCGRVIELIPGGSRVPVTPDRVHEYVHLYAMYKMVGCVQNELNSMRDGLHDVVPLELLSGLAAEDFQLLLCGGSANITMKRLRSIIKFQHTYTHPHTRGAIEKFERMFWKVVSHMDNKQRQQLLYFATGSAGLPANSEAESGLTISVDVIGSGNTDSLPVASTCGQRMSIPLYPSYHMLKKKLLQAIQCQAYGLS